MGFLIVEKYALAEKCYGIFIFQKDENILTNGRILKSFEYLSLKVTLKRFLRLNEEHAVTAEPLRVSPSEAAVYPNEITSE
jgi:hypothetical protein